MMRTRLSNVYQSIDERMTLSNMAVECGAVCGLIAPDANTMDYLQDKNISQYTPVVGDADAQHDRVYQFDLSNLESQITCLPQPDRVVGISNLPEVPITLAFIGSCTGGKLTDLAQAAAVLKGRRVAPQVRMYVVRASQLVRQQAEALGYFGIFERAGVQINLQVGMRCLYQFWQGGVR